MGFGLQYTLSGKHVPARVHTTSKAVSRSVTIPDSGSAAATAACLPFPLSLPPKHNSELYAEDDDGLDDSGQEPAIRRQLRAARAAEKHAKMKAALAEKQAKEAAEAERREQQQQHKTAHRERIEAWKNKNKVRGGVMALFRAVGA